MQSIFSTIHHRSRILVAALLSAPAIGAAEPSAATAGAPPRFVGNMVHHNPGEPLFVTKYNDPAWLKSQGWNAQIIKTFPQCAITWDSFDPAILPPGSKDRDWSENLGRTIDTQIVAANKAGMPVFIFTDMLVVPRSLFAKYGEEMSVIDDAPKVLQPHESSTQAKKAPSTAEKGTLNHSGRRFSILKPVAQKVVREQMDQIFKRFPTLDGIVIRFGETYLHDAPGYTGGSPVRTAEEHQMLLSLLREEVCVKRNKKLIYRTWSFGNGFHSNPEFYQQVTDTIEPHPNLRFSMKHTSSDYSRDMPFNRTIGVGRHPQLVEVSANQAGLYGKCAFPYYCGKGVIDGWEHFGSHAKGLSSIATNPQFSGLWTWSHGDGWVGPYKTNEFWTNLNTAVIREFGLNPQRSEKEIFEAYCRDNLRLSPEQTATLRDLLLTATQATYHGQESDLIRDGDHFVFTSWWCRDEYLTAVNVDAMVKTGLVDKAIAEKDRAVEDWIKVERLAKSLNLSDKTDQEFVEVSSTYGRIRIEICREIWRMQLLAAQANLSGKQLDRDAMKSSIARYDALWADWRKLKSDHECCPTLYRDETAVHCGPPFATVLADYRRMITEVDR